MNVQFSGGSAKQQRWVQDAINQCSFPLSSINPTVTVQWSNQMPSDADTRHPYMVTQVQGDGSFLITIVSWADDPSNPSNQGLPNPNEDIYDFYKQSFVHELGHVVIDSTFNPGGSDTDPRIAQACSLFWRASSDSGPGRRYGTIGDWDTPALAWGDEIREAVAETFKISFYQGRLIYQNRTNWEIDPSAWKTLVSLISPSHTVGSMVTVSDLFTQSPDPNVSGAGGIETGSGLLVGSFGPGEGLSVVLNAPFGAGFLPIVVGVQVLAAGGVPPNGMQVWIGANRPNDDGVFGLDGFSEGNPLVPGPDFGPPFWLGATVDEDGSGYQGLWVNAPTIDSVPDAIVNHYFNKFGAGNPFPYPNVAIRVASESGGSITLSDAFFTSQLFAASPVPVDAKPPHPDAEIQVAAGLRGAVRLG